MGALVGTLTIGRALLPPKTGEAKVTVPVESLIDALPVHKRTGTSPIIQETYWRGSRIKAEQARAAGETAP